MVFGFHFLRTGDLTAGSLVVTGQTNQKKVNELKDYGIQITGITQPRVSFR